MTIDEALKAWAGLTDLYKGKSTNGAVIAYIPEKNKFYCSFCSYGAPYGGERQIVAKALGDSAERVVAECAFEVGILPVE